MLLCHVLAGYRKDPEWKERANATMEHIIGNVEAMGDMGYADGFTVVGWCLEWLAQNGMFEASTDHLLEDFDDSVYKLVMFGLDKNLSLSNGAIGKSAYFLKRYQSLNFQTHRYKIICLQECLVLLTDEISEEAASLVEDIRTEGITDFAHLVDLSHAIIVLSKVWRYKINIECIENAIYLSVPFVIRLLQDLSEDSRFCLRPEKMKEAVLRLGYSVWYAGMAIGCQDWKQKGELYLGSYLREWLKTPYTEEKTCIFPILARLTHYTGNERYKAILADALEDLDKNMPGDKLNNGMYSILLSVLGCLHEEYHHWDEALLFG